MYKKIAKWFLFFIVCAIIGWIYEVAVEYFELHHGFVNRGVLFGPWLPVYGFGGILFVLAFQNTLKNKNIKQKLILLPLIFLGTMIIATITELITSYLCDLFLGYFPWSYSQDAYNFDGRIALKSSVRFGIGGVLLIYLLLPVLDKFYKHLEKKKLLNIIYVIFVIFIIDLLVKIL